MDARPGVSKTNENTYRLCVFLSTLNSALGPSSGALVQVLRSLIEATRGRIAQRVNSGLVSLYWQVGKRLREEVLGNERAAYGEQTLLNFEGVDAPLPIGRSAASRLKQALRV